MLLDLHQLSDAALGGFLDLVSDQVANRDDCLCSLLFAAPNEPQAFAEHLARRSVLDVPNASTPKQFRYFDPGTMLQLPRLLGAAGMAWLLGPSDSVVVPWAGNWTELSASENAPSAFRLKGTHLEALSRLGVVNRVAMGLSRPDNALDWERTCAAIDLHVQRAMTQHHLRQQADLVAFAGHAMVHHPAFDQHPRIRNLLETLSSATPDEELDYRELSSHLSTDDWQQIRKDLLPPPPSAQT
ncbi:MAG: hypothetical protein C4K60_03470 [Ideonella sp. MAG2]|nr:MAG: hypothetical protein C4K60_03470 [Ideonella sp. MAG2]